MYIYIHISCLYCYILLFEILLEKTMMTTRTIAVMLAVMMIGIDAEGKGAWERGEGVGNSADRNFTN